MNIMHTETVQKTETHYNRKAYAFLQKTSVSRHLYDKKEQKHISYKKHTSNIFLHAKVYSFS